MHTAAEPCVTAAGITTAIPTQRRKDAEDAEIVAVIEMKSISVKC